MHSFRHDQGANQDTDKSPHEEADKVTDTSSLPYSHEIAVTRPYENVDEDAHKSTLSFPDSKSYAKSYAHAYTEANKHAHESADARESFSLSDSPSIDDEADSGSRADRSHLSS